MMDDTGDIYLLCLKKYYEEHGTINNISANTTVEYEGKMINLSTFIHNMKFKHRYYLEGSTTMSGVNSKRSLERYKALEEMGIDWNITAIKRGEDVLEEDEVRYLREHYREYGTIDDITYDTVVEYNGKKLNIGLYIRTLKERHARYVRGDFTRFSNSSISVARYKILDELHITWENSRYLYRAILDNDVYLSFLREHYKKHGTIDTINTKYVAEYNGTKLRVGAFLTNTVSLYNKYISGEGNSICASSALITRYNALKEMGFDFEKSFYRSSVNDDIMIEYLREHFKKYGTINNIKARDIVTYRGNELNIGGFITRMRSNYQHYVEDKTDKRYNTELLLLRYSQLALLDFNFTYLKPVSIEQVARDNGVSIKGLKRLVKELDGNIDKALLIAKANCQYKMKKQCRTRGEISIESLMKLFDVNYETLISFLNKTRTQRTPKGDPILYKDSTLKDFCLKNGYNYEVILRAVNLKRTHLVSEDMESLINRSIIHYTKHGQSAPSTWIYAKYGNEVLVKHMLLYMGFDYRNVLDDISNNLISLDEAFCNESFRRCKNNRDYLEGIYHEFIDNYNNIGERTCSDLDKSEEIFDYSRELVTKYHLSREEFLVITNSFKAYTNAIYTYHLFDVGFEKDGDVAVSKAINYNFDEEDIERAFFLPLNFDKRVLIGRDSELYKRRSLLKNFIMSWNDLSVEERQKNIRDYNVSQYELSFIEGLRKDIDTFKVKVLK